MPNPRTETVTIHECEVGSHSPRLQQRVLNNPISRWSAEMLESDRRHPTPEMHLDWDDIVLRDERAVVKAPRSFAKSTRISKNLPLYLACNYAELIKMANPPIKAYREIFLMAGSGALARKWLDQIQQEIENNENIRIRHGDLKGDTWNQDEMWTQIWDEEKKKYVRGVHIKAVGAGYRQRGWRPEILICDDMDDDEEVLSDERLEKLYDWWDGAVTNMLDEVDCKVFVIGTTLAEETLLEHICDKENWNEYHFAAYRKDDFDEVREEAGWEVWPSKWPHERLVERGKEIGRKKFAAEFLNDPISTEAPIFERKWINHYEHDSLPFQKELEKSLYTVVAIDPAISRHDGTDYSAIVTLSATFEQPPRLYLRVEGVKQGHWPITRQVTESIRMYEKFNANALGIEIVAYQEALQQLIEDWMDTERRNIRIKALKPDGDKERRANAVSPLVERGCLYIDKRDAMSRKVVDQMVRFKPGKKNIKKDLFDAIVYCLIMINIWSKSRKGDSEGGRVLPKGTKASEHTGILS